jgi:predicted ATP-binding protein involved in virulence
MYLKKVTLKNFRCFEHFELDLHPQLTVLVGRNGAGKTAVLDGIAAGLSPVLRYLSSANQRLSAAGAGIRDTDFRLVPFGKKTGKERWGASEYAQVIVEAADGLRWDDWRASTKSKGIAPPERIGQKQLASWLSDIYESFKSPTRELLPVFAYYGAQRGNIEVPQKLHKAKENYDHPTSALVDSLNPRSDFREMLAWFEQEESSELRKNKGERPEDWDLSAALEGVREAIRLLLNDDFGNPYFNDSHRFVVESKTRETPFQVSQLSQGYQAMLALGMDFARRLALGNDHLDFVNCPVAVDKLLRFLSSLGRPLDGMSSGIATKFAPAVMLVDEIDLHLHPEWQQRVLGDLMRTFPGTQFIVTSHSPQVLTTVRSESIRILSDSGVYAAPAGTEGADSSRLLKQIFGVDPRPPETEATQELKRYLELVDHDKWNDPEATALRRKLDQRYQGEEPALVEADLLIENKKWERGE